MRTTAIIFSLICFVLCVIPPACDQSQDPTPAPSPPPAACQTCAKLQALQKRCWSIKLEWHHQTGWTAMTKEDVGTLASETCFVSDEPTLLSTLESLEAEAEK